MFNFLLALIVTQVQKVNSQAITVTQSSGNAFATATSTAISNTLAPIVFTNVYHQQPAARSIILKSTSNKKKLTPIQKPSVLTIVKSSPDIVIESAPSPSPAADGCTSVAATAAAVPELSTLVSALQAAGLVDDLSDPELVATVLAPTNAAFNKLIQEFNSTAEEILQDSQILNILRYHVIGGVAARASDLSDGLVLTTLLAQDLTVDLSNGVTFVGFDSSANVQQADIVACNAIIHIIDNVLLPDFSQLS